MHLLFGIEAVLEEKYSLLTTHYLKIVFAASVLRKQRCCPPDVLLLSLLVAYLFTSALPLFLTAHNTCEIRIALVNVYVIDIIAGLDINDQFGVR